MGNYKLISNGGAKRKNSEKTMRGTVGRGQKKKKGMGAVNLKASAGHARLAPTGKKGVPIEQRKNNNRAALGARCMTAVKMLRGSGGTRDRT